MVDDHREERHVELGVGGRDALRRARDVGHARVGMVARGLGAHHVGRLDGEDARVEGLGEERREAPGPGAEVEDRQARARRQVAREGLHPEPAHRLGHRAPGVVGAGEALVVIDHQSASGSGRPSKASVGIGAGAAIPRRSAST